MWAQSYHALESEGFHLVGELAHDLRFRNNHAIDSGLAKHFGDSGVALGNLHLDPQLVAGNHQPTEFRLFYRYEQNQLVLSVRN